VNLKALLVVAQSVVHPICIPRFILDKVVISQLARLWGEADPAIAGISPGRHPVPESCENWLPNPSVTQMAVKDLEHLFIIGGPLKASAILVPHGLRIVEGSEAAAHELFD